MQRRALLAAPPAAATLAGASLLPAAAEAQAAPILTEEFMVPSGTPGIEIFVRNKRQEGVAARPDRTLLFVHGATYPASTAFDLPLGGLSWMDYIAAHGWDVWLVDLRGYGRSTRPSEIGQPAKDNAPIVTTDVAVRDVGTAVDYILKRRNASKVSLLGWSWGTSIMGTYTAANNGRVDRLVLYAPLWLRHLRPCAVLERNCSSG